MARPSANGSAREASLLPVVVFVVIAVAVVVLAIAVLPEALRLSHSLRLKSK